MTNNTIKNMKPLVIAAMLIINLFAFNRLAVAQFGGGSGTENDPYCISTTAHWLQLANNVNALNNAQTYEGVYFRLEADLDFPYATFQPVGRILPDGNRPFKGHFNGMFHTIRNASFSKNGSEGQGVGLFGYVDGGVIRNLTLGGTSSLKGFMNVGGIVGFLEGGSLINNCLVDTGVTIAPAGNQGSYFGGIVGTCTDNCTISNCISYATVTNNDYNAVQFLGGIVGLVGVQNQSSPIAITNCWNFGSVTGSSYVGGICGRKGSGDYIMVSNCAVGGDCAIGALGVEGSSQGTDEGVSVKHVATITFTNEVNGSVNTPPSISHRSINYYECGTTISLTLAYTGSVPEGYTKQFEASAGTLDATGSGYALTLPALVTNVTVSVAATEPLRDIGYEQWITITTSAQQFTGSALSPAVTVIDNMSGTPITLSEGTDYHLVMPDDELINPGNYTIGVVGMGNYGGQAATVFTITHPNFEGFGTEESPYLIHNISEMNILNERVNAGESMSGLFFRLEADLDYSCMTYTPIGNGIQPFSGNFDGGFHTISHVNINAIGPNQALFGKLEGGTVRNLYLAESEIIAGSGWDNIGQYVGGIVGSADENSSIELCQVEESVSLEGDYVGGIVGINLGTVSDCYNAATVTCNDYNCGGIAGESYGSISGCINTGMIDGKRFSGGITGRAILSSMTGMASSIEGCVNQGMVTGSSYVGGIAGRANNSIIGNCLNLANVAATGNQYLGGIVGINDGSTLFNNYYAVNCTTGGINGSDVFGQAMKGWQVIADDEDILMQLFPIDDQTGAMAGITYDGVRYVGAGETTKLLIMKSETAPEGIIAANVGILKPLDEELYEMNDILYLLTTPAEGQDVEMVITQGLGLTVAGFGTSTNGSYRLIALPVVVNVAAATVCNIFAATEYDLYYFDQGEELEWRNHKAAPFDFENGKGYLYATKEEQTLVFRGTYNTSTEPFEVPLDYSETNISTDMRGWNLVGNPFTVEATIGERDFYRMNPDGTEVIVAEDPSIAAMEGIFVHTDTDSDTVIFTRATRATGNGGRIILNLSRNSTLIDRAIVRMCEGNNLPKFQIKDNNTKVYIPQQGKDFAVVATQTAGEMPLNFKASENGTYTLSIHLDGVEMSYLHLIDNLTGADIDLLQTPSYTFTAKTTDYESCFKLVFSANDEDGPSTGSGTFAFVSNGNIIVNGKGTLQVFDVLGRQLFTKELSTTNYQLSNINAPGVYVLRLIDGGNVKTQKMVIE